MVQHQKSKECKAKFLDQILQQEPYLSNPSTPVPIHYTPTPPSLECAGTSVLWSLENPFTTYPFTIHQPTSRLKPGYMLLKVCHIQSLIYIRSNQCSRYLTDPTSPSCSFCTSAHFLVKKIAEHAEKPPSNIDRNNLSHHQLQERLHASEVKEQKTAGKMLNASRALERLRVHQKTWTTLLNLLGTHTIPAVHRIFKQAKRRSWSVEKLLEMVEKAKNGVYCSKDFDEYEYDLATVVYELGGGAALHALHKSPFAFPALSTIASRRRDIQIKVTVGSPTMTDLLANIETMFMHVPPDHKKVGITLALDEISCNGLCYLADTDCIAGLCEHAAKELDTMKMGENLDVIRAVRGAIQEGRIHVGQEILVAAFGRNDGTNYGARPVLLMPTCKMGSFKDAAKIIQLLREAWRISPYGEALHGQIWSIASDGDPKRRPAMFLHCMLHELSPDDGLGLHQHVGDLVGFNIWTGSRGETQDLDWKHCLKRICKLLCTREGLLIHGTIINKSILRTWLERLTHINWINDDVTYSLLELAAGNPESIIQKIETLLSPKDAQDVPRAVKLLQLIAELRNIDLSTLNPSETKTHQALCILGEMLDALLFPFVNTGSSISEQITSLAKFAFICCGLFKSSEGDFMPHHLYSDLQCMVRTAIMRIAHTKQLDPERKVYLCLLGDDILEILFGRVRMIGGHSPNVNADEMRHRMASAIRLDTIFQKYPEWEQLRIRLNMKRSRHVDHLTPMAMTGELRASSCDLKLCWEQGMSQAEAMLAKYGKPIDFKSLFKDGQKGGADLMRPNGGKYPGISKAVDRSIVTEGSDSDESLAPSGNESATHATSLEDLSDRSNYDFLLFDGQVAYEAETRAREHLGPQRPHSIWMDLDGKPAHKRTIIRIFMDPSLDVDHGKSHDRLLRVRYYSIGGHHDHENLFGAHNRLSHVNLNAASNIFSIQSLYATLICIDNTTCLAVLQCTSLKAGSEYCPQAPADEIGLTHSTFDVTGQILSLIATTVTPSEDSDTRTAVSWLWDSSFASLNSVKSRTGTQSELDRVRHLNITVSGKLVYVFTPSHTQSVSIDDEDSRFDASSMNKTWSISEQVLHEAEQILHQRVIGDEEMRDRIPLFGSIRGGRFPYKMTSGAIYINHSTTKIKPPQSAAALLPCLVCSRQVCGPDRQNHMGRHILRRIRGVEDSIQISEDLQIAVTRISLEFPCGFCGQSTLNGQCELRIQSGKAHSTCPQAYNFMVSHASKVSKSKPCTNVPIPCRLCTQVHWKYNMRRHLQESHPSWETNLSQTEVKDFRSKIIISDKEEQDLGIPEDNIGRYSFETVSSAHDARRLGRSAVMTDGHGDSPRRHTRHFSTPSLSRAPPIPFIFNLQSVPEESSYYNHSNGSTSWTPSDVFGM